MRLASKTILIAALIASATSLVAAGLDDPPGTDDRREDRPLIRNHQHLSGRRHGDNRPSRIENDSELDKLTKETETHRETVIKREVERHKELRDTAESQREQLREQAKELVKEQNDRQRELRDHNRERQNEIKNELNEEIRRVVDSSSDSGRRRR